MDIDELENQTRRTIGVVASGCGLVMLVASLGTAFRGNPPWAAVALAVTVVTGIAVISSYFNRYFMTAAIVQSVLAMITLMLGAATALTIGTMIGPVLILIGAQARVCAVAKAPVVVPIESGRKYVYLDNKVVAIEDWLDGKLVASRPFTHR